MEARIGLLGGRRGGGIGIRVVAGIDVGDGGGEAWLAGEVCDGEVSDVGEEGSAISAGRSVRSVVSGRICGLLADARVSEEEVRGVWDCGFEVWSTGSGVVASEAVVPEEPDRDAVLNGGAARKSPCTGAFGKAIFSTPGGAISTDE